MDAPETRIRKPNKSGVPVKLRYALRARTFAVAEKLFKYAAKSRLGFNATQGPQADD